MNCPDFNIKLHLLKDISPDNLITLFTLYYKLEIVDRIVEATNAYQKAILENITKSRASK